MNDLKETVLALTSRRGVRFLEKALTDLGRQFGPGVRALWPVSERASPSLLVEAVRRSL